MVEPPSRPAASRDADRLTEWMGRHRRIFVLTGAGVSTASGIPDYRDDGGQWKRRPPVQFREFVQSESTRRRYWARSLLGWPRMADARPNPAHRALADLESLGRVRQLVTQNVDGLHQRAGSVRVLDLHGRLDEVVCLACRARRPRAAYQEELLEANPAWHALDARTAPDGDADLEGARTEGFRVPACPCGGPWKPDVVFFGENVPRTRVERAYEELSHSDALLVVGSSLMVFSGYRFVRTAGEREVPVAILNRGRTRGDGLASLIVRAEAAETLASVLPLVAPRDDEAAA